MGKGLNDDRMAWIVALCAVAGAAAMAFGFSTPAQRMTKVESRIDDHETRIQKLEDMHEYLSNIADAVGAMKPKRKDK